MKLVISFFDSFYVMPFSDLNQQEEVLQSNVKRCLKTNPEISFEILIIFIIYYKTFM